MVPGLLAPVRAGESRHPITAVDSSVLRQWFARCQQRQPAVLAEQLAAYPGASYSQDAAALAQALALPQAPAWLFAAPVWLRPEHAGIYLLGSRPLQLSLAEAQAYCAELNDWLQQDGMQLHPISASRWLLSLPEPSATGWTPLAEAIGCDLRHVAPQGEGSLRWQSRLTEWQMLLNQSPLNQTRQQNRLPPVHSLWLWGRAPTSLPTTLRSTPQAEWVTLPADSLLAQTLPGTKALADAVAGSATQLTVIDECLQDAFAHGDIAGYQTAYQQFLMETWLPLQHALNNSDIAELRLQPDDGFVYSQSRQSRWKFWQRAALPAVLQER